MDESHSVPLRFPGWLVSHSEISWCVLDRYIKRTFLLKCSLSAVILIKEVIVTTNVGLVNAILRLVQIDKIIGAHHRAFVIIKTFFKN